MVFLGLGRKTDSMTDEERKAYLMKKDREHNEKKREDHLKDYEAKRAAEATEPSRDIKDSTPKPKKNLKQRVGEFKTSLRVKAEKRKLDRFRKAKEAIKNKSDEDAKVKSESEKEVFGEELSEDERKEYDEFNSNRRAVKAERRRKLKEGISKLSKAGSGEGGGGLAEMFSIGSKDDTPFDVNIVDDDKQYGKKSGIVDDGNIFGLGDLGKENPFAMGEAGKNNPFDFVVTDDKAQYGKKAGAVMEGNPFGFGDLGKNNPFGTPKANEDMFKIKFLKESGKKGKKGSSDPYGLFGNDDLRQKKHDFERMFSLTWGEKPKGKRKAKPLKDPLGLI